MSNEEPDPDELLSSAQVAVELGRAVPTVTRMARTGQLKPVTKIAGLRGPYLFRRADVEALKAAAVSA